MDIRPHPVDILHWVIECGFAIQGGAMDLPPWHYGFTALKR
jgi:hypothetical protein